MAKKREAKKNEGARLCVIVTNNREFDLLKAYASNSLFTYSNNDKFIWTLMLPGENKENVEKVLTHALKELTAKTGCKYMFEEVVDISTIGVSALNMEPLLKECFRMLGGLNVTSFDNMPGRPTVFLSLRPGRSDVGLFLPRDTDGNFVNLEEQTLCLKALHRETKVSKIFSANLELIFNKKLIVHDVKKGEANCVLIYDGKDYFFEEFPPCIIEVIMYIRMQRRKYGLSTPTEPPQITIREKGYRIKSEDIDIETLINSKDPFGFNIKIS